MALNQLRLLAAFSGIFLLCGVSYAEITVTVTPTLAPNAYGSPSWDTWEQNSITALETGVFSYGDPTQPSYYQAQSLVSAEETIVTGYPSWLGLADPGTVFGSAFAGEYGNRLTFGLTILGNGQQFSISQLGFNGVSNDAGNMLGFSFGGYDYSPNYVGVVFGTGGAPNTYITSSGDPTQLVDAVYSRGSGNSLEADCTVCNTADDQSQLDQTAASMQEANLTELTGTYYLTPDGVQADAIATGSGTFEIAEAPEPSTWLLMMMLSGAAAIAIARRSGKIGLNGRP
jgi:hypothetical protein